VFQLHARSDAAAGARDDEALVVLLWGWVGSTPRLLAKYAAVFLARGASAVYTTTAPTIDVFLFHGRVRRLAAAGLELLRRRHAGERAVLAYYSNGGALVHRHVLELLAESGDLPSPTPAPAAGGEGAPLRPAAAPARAAGGARVCGALFDSAPAYPSADSSARALTEGIRSRALRAAAYALAVCALPPLLAAVHGAGFAPRFMAPFAADALPCPALYVYSTGDALTDCAAVDALVAARRGRHARGPAGVSALRFGPADAPSAHVAHLLAHPARYADAVGALLRAAAAEGGEGGGGGRGGAAASGAAA